MRGGIRSFRSPDSAIFPVEGASQKAGFCSGLDHTRTLRASSAMLSASVGWLPLVSESRHVHLRP